MSPSTEQSAADTLLVGESTRSHPGGAGRRFERGEAIGRYLVLGSLGAGGMGVVYSAYDPELDRRIAIKVLRDEPDDAPPTDRLRLLREAQAMARVNHPNVVTVHDVGTHDGRVYIAMELVAGKTLRQWLAAAPRGWREVIDVLSRAGRGLQAAHDERLVHGDFKPDNVMVADDDRVLVMDFGLAQGERAAATEVDELRSADSNLLATRPVGAHGIVGTPAYMSPEQLGGASADARSDQFGFCVALYEALYAVLPFRGQQLPELVFAISTGAVREPPSGSAVPAFVRRIVERGLRPEPVDRWPSVAAVIDALDDRPDRRRKRRLAIATATAGITAALGAAVWWSRRGDEPCSGAAARLVGVWDDARRGEVETVIDGLDAQWAETTTASVIAGLDGYASDWVAMHTEACRATTVYGAQSETLMDLRIGCLENARMDLQAAADQLATADPQVLANAHRLVTSLPALTACADAEGLSSEVPPPSDPEVVAELDAARRSLASARAAHRAGRYKDAEAALVELGPRIDALGYTPARAELLVLLANVQSSLGHEKIAQSTAEEALRISLANGQIDLAIDSTTRLVVLVGNHGRRPAEGLIYANVALGLAERTAEPLALTNAHTALGTAHTAAGMPVEANAAYRRALELDPGLDPARTGHLHTKIGGTLFDSGRFDEALVELRAAAATLESALGANHPELLSVHITTGLTLFNLGKFDEVELEYRRALEIAQQALGNEHPDAIGVRFNMASLFARTNRLEEAERELRSVTGLLEETLGADHPRVAMGHANLATVLLQRKQFAAAEIESRRAIAGMAKSLGPDHGDLAAPVGILGVNLADQGRHDEALVELRRALAMRETMVGADHPQIARDLMRVAASLLELERRSEAVPLLERAVSIFSSDKALLGDLARARFGLARALWPTDPERALTLGKQAVEGLDGELKERARAWVMER